MNGLHHSTDVLTAVFFCRTKLPTGRSSLQQAAATLEGTTVAHGRKVSVLFSPNADCEMGSAVVFVDGDAYHKALLAEFARAGATIFWVASTRNDGDAHERAYYQFKESMRGECWIEYIDRPRSIAATRARLRQCLNRSI